MPMESQGPQERASDSSPSVRCDGNVCYPVWEGKQDDIGLRAGDVTASGFPSLEVVGGGDRKGAGEPRGESSVERGPKPQDSAESKDTAPAPRPLQSRFDASQISSILADRDRAMALHRQGGVGGDLKPVDKIDGGKDVPNTPGDDQHQPERVSFRGDEMDSAVDAAIKSHRPMVIKVGTEWCGPCQMLESQTLPQLKDELAQKAIYVKVDADSSRRLAQQLGANSYPTILVVKPVRDESGNISYQTLARTSGFQGVSQLRSFVEGGFARFE